jgi:hypothetical protein
MSKFMHSGTCLDALSYVSRRSKACVLMFHVHSGVYEYPHILTHWHTHMYVCNSAAAQCSSCWVCQSCVWSCTHTCCTCLSVKFTTRLSWIGKYQVFVCLWKNSCTNICSVCTVLVLHAPRCVVRVHALMYACMWRVEAKARSVKAFWCTFGYVYTHTYINFCGHKVKWL